MLNNILNGYRPLIIKLGVISLLAFCIAFAVSPGNAQNSNPGTPKIFEVPSNLICSSTEDFLKSIQGSAREQIFAMGESDNSSNYIVSFWTNPKTKSWTIAINDVTVPEITCILHTGEKLMIKFPGSVSA